jgi:hypothetical protein
MLEIAKVLCCCRGTLEDRDHLCLLLDAQGIGAELMRKEHRQANQYGDEQNGETKQARPDGKLAD